MTTMERIYYTVEEVAQKLRVNTVTVLRYIRREELNAYKMGNTYRINADDLERFLEARRTKREKESK